MKYSRAAVRQLERDNARQPVVLQEVPREMWPPENYDPDRLRVLRSRGFLVQEFTCHPPALVRLSVARTSVGANGRWSDQITWDELQMLKGQAGYGQMTAVEVYPPDSDVVNVANMRHLWIMNVPLPFAWRK